MWWVSFPEKLGEKCASLYQLISTIRDMLGTVQWHRMTFPPKATTLGKMTQKGGRYALQAHSRSSHRFPDVCWYKFRCRRGISLTHSFRVNPWIQDYEICPPETRGVVLWFGVKHVDIFNRLGEGNWWADILIRCAARNEIKRGLLLKNTRTEMVLLTSRHAVCVQSRIWFSCKCSMQTVALLWCFYWVP